MSVYDKAHELARALSQCSEYKNYKRALDRIKGDEKAKEMFLDFRKKQLEIQMDQISGKDTGEKMKQLENLYQVLSYNDDLKNLLEAEAKFATLVADIQGILSKAMDLDLKD
ncbi:hypothetical protein H0A61_02728 [Koleobacter methoxysyntrophicus]|jgi:cell fate (sporulation/competence/biofilm development) regulator YlbF (YheA/YmcA/DUF963 family)|uniref:UPF0342 protein H0A61_02728 n=1 Tax=Koleobacter methoxysyntrophicus TaxID=2751313 RepID=A0A8A0RQU3_9FIRM|nr:YlbF family regulator [Koleobacter methoxysyntrophicus]QSQ10324.1 hypothetical protein H0A61_02728 [Koleobacter methoxysyntrophicus]